jgi:hypothetical protein
MSDKDNDIFGKIDALLGKRDADIMGDKYPNNDDFPRLTEVIDGNSAEGWRGRERRVRMPVTDAAQFSDRRHFVRRKNQVTDLMLHSDNEDLNKLLESIECRLKDLFSRHQLQMQDDLLRIVREALSSAANKKL